MQNAWYAIVSIWFMHLRSRSHRPPFHCGSSTSCVLTLTFTTAYVCFIYRFSSNFLLSAISIKFNMVHFLLTNRIYCGIHLFIYCRRWVFFSVLDYEIWLCIISGSNFICFIIKQKNIYKMIKWALVSPTANDINGQTAAIPKSRNIFYLVIT